MNSADQSRFEFGKNWRHFLRVINEARIQTAVASIQQMLQCTTLEGRTFLDVGSGSGLFSLAASRLGASVRSFDFDPQSVACTQELKLRFTLRADWEITSGSILDDEFIHSLGQYDVVYSWGVLHHTSEMWQGLENCSELVKPSGLLAISIYNDQGGASRRWKTIKRFYNRVPRAAQTMIAGTFFLQHELQQAALRALRMQNPLPFRDWERKKQDRGMSAWHDAVDWIGGYPFEVAKPEEIFDFFRKKQFDLRHLKTQSGGYGCNEFVFEKQDS